MLVTPQIFRPEALNESWDRLSENLTPVTEKSEQNKNLKCTEGSVFLPDGPSHLALTPETVCVCVRVHSVFQLRSH